MNYYGAKDLADSFRTVRKNTITIAQEIPEEKYNFRPAPDTRTVGELLTHLALAYSFQYHAHAEKKLTTLDGFDFPAFVQRITAQEKQPRTKEQIIDLLRTSGDQWATWVAGLSDEFLEEKVQMRPGMVPPAKTRFEMILSVKEHEMHHRGQLMLIERMIGITPHLTRQMQERMAALTAKS
ncbi:MAG TPA: DinB family protein [Candidatus Acidoferrales bacterium]|nr:DinB family protein [Candidatus Acidoferrales bacterium]